MSVQMKYTLSDFDNILFNGINYKLPFEVLNIISNLENELQNVEILETNPTKKYNDTRINDLKYTDKKRMLILIKKIIMIVKV